MRVRGGAVGAQKVTGMVSAECLRAIAKSLTTGVVDVLPVALWDKTSSFGARRMTASELQALVSIIRQEDKTGWTLLHLADIVSAFGNLPSVTKTPVEASLPSSQTPTTASPATITGGAPETTPIETPNLSTPQPGAASNKPATSSNKVISVEPVASSNKVISVQARGPSSVTTTESKEEEQDELDEDVLALGTEPKGVFKGSSILRAVQQTEQARPSVMFKAPGAAPRAAAPTSAEDGKKSKMPKGNMLRMRTNTRIGPEPVRRSRMQGYSAGDIARVLRLTVGADISRAESLFSQFDVDNSHEVDGNEFGKMLEFVLGEKLTSTQLDAVFDMMAESHETVHMSDFIDFFCSHELEGDVSMFSRVNRSTVTAVGLSADQQTVVFGGTDCVAKLYRLHNGSRVLSRKFSKQISSVVISSNGDRIGVSCHGGIVQWVNSTTDELIFEWTYQHEVHSLALSASNSVLAIGAADSSVRLYGLDDGSQRYRFYAGAPVRSVCMAENYAFLLELEDGQNTLRLTDAELPAGMSLDSASECLEHISVVLRGTVMHRSDEHDHSEWTALHNVLQSTRWTLTMGLFVIASATVTVLHEANLIRRDPPVFQNLLSLAFAFEFTFRALSHNFAEKNMSFFVRRPLNMLDLCIIFTDVLLIAFATSSGVSSNDVLQTLLRKARLLRMCRLMNVLAYKVSHLHEHDSGVEHAIRLSDGTVVKTIPNGQITPINKTWSAQQKYSSPAAFKTQPQEPSQSEAVKLRETTRHGAERFEALNRMERYDEGTPVKVRLMARVKKAEKECFVAAGCEDHKTRTWQYDITVDQMLKGSVYFAETDSDVEALTKTRNSHAHKTNHAQTESATPYPSSRKFHVQNFTHTVNR